MEWTTGIAISKIFHPDLALFRNGIAEGYYELKISQVILFLAWGIVIYATLSGLYRMAAGSPKGATQVLLSAGAGLLLGFTPTIRGSSVSDAGIIWNFYHGVYSKLYNGQTLAKLATAQSFRQIVEQQNNTFLALARLKAEISLLQKGTDYLGNFGNKKIGEAIEKVKTAAQAGTKLIPVINALQTAIEQIRNQIKWLADKLGPAIDKAIQDTVMVAVRLIEVNAFFIYLTATMVIFSSLFWPLIAALIVFPSTMKASIAGVGMVVGGTLGMVMAGPMMLTGLAVVFNTTANALTQYQETINTSVGQIRGESQRIAKTLDQASRYASAATETVEKGLGILESAKAKLTYEASLGNVDPKTTIAGRICKLKIEVNEGDIVPQLKEDNSEGSCIEANSQVSTSQIDEYYAHYKEMMAKYEREISSLGKPKETNLGVVDQITSGIIGMLTRLQIQLGIATIMVGIISVVTFLFIGWVISLGVNLGGNAVISRLR